MSTEVVFQIHLVLGYVACCFASVHTVCRG